MKSFDVYSGFFNEMETIRQTLTDGQKTTIRQAIERDGAHQLGDLFGFFNAKAMSVFAKHKDLWFECLNFLCENQTKTAFLKYINLNEIPEPEMDISTYLGSLSDKELQNLGLARVTEKNKLIQNTLDIMCEYQSVIAHLMDTFGKKWLNKEMAITVKNLKHANKTADKLEKLIKAK
ncbi:MAG: hypothetical protein J5I47_08920 [Vicingus serpentipes]|nr:hypothetical protein [Vicingus serpentipes]